MAVGSVLGGIGAIGGAIGGLFGGGGGPDEDDIRAAAQMQADAQIRAAQIQAESAQAAREDVRGYYNYSRDNLKPFFETGQGAVRTLGGLFLPGGGLDPTETLMATPGYQWLQDQGNEALQRYGSAKGMRNSGAALRGATDYGQNLALTKAWNPYVSALQNLSGQGLSAVGTLGGWGMNAGTQMANLAQAGGQALAAGQVGSANALASGEMLGAGDSTMNSIMRSLGVVGGLATNPNIQSLGRSVGNWFSGSGAGTPNFAGSYATGSVLPSFAGSTAGMNMYALGGPVPQGGRPILVGERGPEVFVPNQPGYVVPNHALGQSTSRPVPNEFTATSPAYAMPTPAGPVGLDVDGMVSEIRTLFGG